MNSVDIAEAGVADISVIVSLLNELDQFYGDKTTDESEVRAANVKAALFGNARSVYALLARAKNGETVGFASYSFLWPAAGSSRSLYLKELYVKDGYRQSGAGRHLMNELFSIARREGCSRVEWTTDVTNTEARRFYEMMGEVVYSGKLFYRHEIEP